MSDIKTVLREMVIRLARREANAKFRPLNKKIKELKLAGRQMQRIIDSQQKEISAILKVCGSGDKIKTLPSESLDKARLSPKLILRLRKKLKLSRNLFGRLLGVSSNAVFTWESGRSKPRAACRNWIMSLRGKGKREIKKILQGPKDKTGK